MLELMLEALTDDLFMFIIIFLIMVYFCYQIYLKRIRNNSYNDDFSKEIKELETQIKKDQEVIDQVMKTKRNLEINSDVNSLLNEILYNLSLPLYIVDDKNNLLFINDKFIDFLNIDRSSISFKKKIGKIKSKKLNNLSLIMDMISNDNEEIINGTHSKSKVIILSVMNEIKQIILNKTYYNRNGHKFIVCIMQDFATIENEIATGEIEMANVSVEEIGTGKNLVQ